MAITLSLSGSVLRTESVSKVVTTALNYAVSEAVTQDTIDTVTIAGNGSFNVTLNNITSGKFVLVYVTDSTGSVGLTINGSDTPVVCTSMVLAGSALTSLAIANSSSTVAVNVKVVVGG